MKRLTQQYITKRIIEKLPYLAVSDIKEIQNEIEDIKKERSGNRTCEPAKDHDQVVEAYLKLQSNNTTRE